LGYGGGASLTVTFTTREDELRGATMTPPTGTTRHALYFTTRTPTLQSQAPDKTTRPVAPRTCTDSTVTSLNGTKAPPADEPSARLQPKRQRLDHTVVAGRLHYWHATRRTVRGRGYGPATGPTSTGTARATANQSFTLDTSAARHPTISSAQFPRGEIGTLGDNGQFVFDNDKFTASSYVSPSTAAVEHLPYTSSTQAWTASTKITPGRTY